MAASNWFWIIYVVCVLFGLGMYWPFSEDTRRHAGASLVVFVLIGLLGLGVYGWPIK